MSLRALGPDDGPPGEGRHIGELHLRRLRVGELGAAEAEPLQAHLEGCPACRQRHEALDAEERAFVQAIPYPRFAGGVERAARVPRSARRSRRAALYAGAVSCAAAAGLMLLLRGGGDPGGLEPDLRGNRLKGGAAASPEVRIAGADGRQRSADPGSVTALGAGERLRLGHAFPAGRQLMLVSIDDAGVITRLHAEGSDSSATGSRPGATGLSYLPDSIELTGAGRERLYLLVSDYPFAGTAVDAALQAEYTRAGRDLGRMGDPALPPELRSFTWLFGKP